MKEYRFVLPKVGESGFHYVSRASQARLRMADNAAPLEPFRLQPLIYEIEVLAAVADLAVIVSYSLPASQDRHVLGLAVTHASHVLREMDGGIRVMPHSQQ